jgi:hypothetical protein
MQFFVTTPGIFETWFITRYFLLYCSWFLIAVFITDETLPLFCVGCEVFLCQLRFHHFISPEVLTRLEIYVANCTKKLLKQHDNKGQLLNALEQLMPPDKNLRKSVIMNQMV